MLTRDLRSIRSSFGLTGTFLFILGVLFAVSLSILFVDRELSEFRLMWNYALWCFGGFLFFITVTLISNSALLLYDQNSRNILKSAIDGISKIFQESKAKLYISIISSTAIMFILGSLLFGDEYIWYSTAKQFINLIG